MDTSPLEHAHTKIAKAFAGSGAVIEPWLSVEAVFRHRMYWKPEILKVVLLAESHVFTTLEEVTCSVDLARFGCDAPDQFARFVYCLGYGESGLVSGGVEHNAGTPQFWKLFTSCVHGPSKERFAETLKGGTPDLGRRVRNKIALLSEMKRRGIWLVDASVVGLYNPGAEKTSYVDIQRAMLESWSSFWREQLMRERPSHAICIGVGVYETLRDWLPDLFPQGVTKIEQPNAFLSAERHHQNLLKCQQACATFAPA